MPIFGQQQATTQRQNSGSFGQSAFNPFNQSPPVERPTNNTSFDAQNPFFKSLSAVDALPSQPIKIMKQGPIYGSVSPEKKRQNQFSSNPFYPQP